MSALTRDQLELLQRARDGQPLWGGSVATERLRREADLLFWMRLIERSDVSAYRLTMQGVRVVNALCEQKCMT